MRTSWTIAKLRYRESKMDQQTAILRQVEYYFSDDSFPFDEFLKKLAHEEGKDGYVDLSVIAGFGKMKSFLVGVEDGVAKIATAVESSDSVELNSDKTGVRRRFPIPSEDPAAERTVHAAQFATDEARAEVDEKFSKFGEVESVRFLRNLASDERPYDGGVFVVFKDLSSIPLALEAATKAEITGTAGPAVLKPLAQHFDEFSKKRLGMKMKRDAAIGGEGSGGGGKKRKVEAPPFDEDYTRGIIVEIQGLGEGLDREGIKKACEVFGPVGWVEYERDETKAQVRFNEKEHAQASIDAASSTTGLGLENFTNATASLLDGDEERSYWLKKHEDTVTRMSSRRGGKGRKGGKGKGKGRRRN